MKKFLAIIIIAISFGAVGCGSNNLTEKDVKNDILEQGLNMEDALSTNFDITRKISVTSIEKIEIDFLNDEKNSKTAVADLEFYNNNVLLSGKFKLDYKKYDKEGWKLEKNSASNLKIVSVKEFSLDEINRYLESANEKMTATKVGELQKRNGSKLDEYLLDVDVIVEFEDDFEISKHSGTLTLKLCEPNPKYKEEFKQTNFSLGKLKMSTGDLLEKTFKNEFSITNDVLITDISNRKINLDTSVATGFNIEFTAKDIVNIEWDGKFVQDRDSVALSNIKIRFIDDFNFHPRKSETDPIIINQDLYIKDFKYYFKDNKWKTNNDNLKLKDSERL